MHSRCLCTEPFLQPPPFSCRHRLSQDWGGWTIFNTCLIAVQKGRNKKFMEGDKAEQMITLANINVLWGNEIGQKVHSQTHRERKLSVFADHWEPFHMSPILSFLGSTGDVQLEISSRCPWKSPGKVPSPTIRFLKSNLLFCWCRVERFLVGPKGSAELAETHLLLPDAFWRIYSPQCRSRAQHWISSGLDHKWVTDLS